MNTRTKIKKRLRSVLIFATSYSAKLSRQYHWAWSNGADRNHPKPKPSEIDPGAELKSPRAAGA